MKLLAFSLLLGTALLSLSCSKKDDPASSVPANSDPFLGHWEAESIQITELTPTGQVQNQSTTQQYKSVLEMKSSSFEWSTHPKNQAPVLVHFEYRQVGDTLKMTANIGVFKHLLVRSLTPTSFTLEEQMYHYSSSTSIDLINRYYFHR